MTPLASLTHPTQTAPHPGATTEPPRLAERALRFFISALVRIMYRLRPSGLSSLPARGPAVIVCNHVSFVDGPIIAALSRRPVRFVMDHRVFRMPLLRHVFRIGRAIPIAPAHEDPGLMERAFDDIAAALDAGEVVCIFPEGRLTRDGQLGPFRSGIERILARNPVPVVPMALRGLWGSFFSNADGRAMTGRPKRFRARVEVVCDHPVAARAASAEALREHVRCLRGARL
jgi:1-acyl-sn-glycerol-3-phosphate acyltransferase